MDITVIVSFDVLHSINGVVMMLVYNQRDIIKPIIFDF